ncbi:hypothetical protein HX004_13985 [Myroides sp. 1354]|uniref:hypothetical protein n=1 Tax=unclassified Myroides TaxID=2642485 RepID=UPI002576D85E|nr:MULTISPECIES: hypothetical protein [unclassified Myroides]MDM1045864.1 hypothetical protein [Myroides sp. R163-1]MDM1056874.1 hypothetical protein [Myroides sp. 1354]MDM1070069.1 hypothetical protein [Myroides sp. 1372]
MARELATIKLEMTDRFITDPTVVEIYEIDQSKTFEQQFSKVSLENILFNIVAFAIWVFEKLLTQHQKEIDDTIASSRIHTQKWYREKALAFMFGKQLNDSDVYDTSDMTEQEIVEAKIIANAAPVKMQGYLRMKVVKSLGDELGPLSTTELTAFESYMNYVTDAGTYVIPTSNQADDLKLHLDVYYDPMILAQDGSRLDGTSETPTLDVINSYLKSLRFNGAFVETKLMDEIQSVHGVTMVKIVGAWSKYGSYDYESTINPNAGKINEVRIADAGYMKLDQDNTTINYIAFSDYD